MNALVDDFEAETSRVRGILEKHGLRAVSLNSAFEGDLFERDDLAWKARFHEQVHGLCRFMRALEIEVGTHYPGYIADWKNDPEYVWEGTVQSLRDIQTIS